MPNLQDIEQFKTELDAVGNEAEILAERGESIGEVPLPEEGLSEDLSELLGNTLAEEEAPPQETEPDFAVDDLGDLGDAEISEEELTEGFETEVPSIDPEAPSDEVPPEPAAGEESDAGVEEDFDLDLDDIFTDETAPDEAFEEPVFDESSTEPEPEPVPSDTDLEFADAFGDLDESEPESEEQIDDDFTGISEAEYAGLTDNIPEEEAPEPEEETPESEEIDDFALPAEFSLDEEGTEELPSEEPFENDSEITDEAFDTGVEAPEIPETSEEELDFDESEPVTEDETFELPDDTEFEDFDQPSEGPSEEIGEELGDESTEFAFEEEDIEGFEVPSEEPGESVEIPEEFAVDGESEFEAADEPEQEEAELGEELDGADEIDEDSFDLDDFSLGDLGEQFGAVDESEAEMPETEEDLNPALAVDEEVQLADEAFSLTDEQFEAVQHTLGTLPINLRIIIENAIGEGELEGANLESLMDALVRGRSPKDIASLTGRLTGQRISIPSQYEKRTGLEFEAEIGTFAYALRYNILPVLRTVGIGILIAGLLTFLGYRFLYRPIKANMMYNQGIEAIENGGYIPGNELFARGQGLWQKKSRYYQYAEKFVEQNRDDLAAQKYEQLLFRYPDDKKGILDFAKLETYERAAYEDAEGLLNRLLSTSKHMNDYQALIQAGDNYMEWAREDWDKYEAARSRYATILDIYGPSDEVMFRMLRYFVRTDRQEEVIDLKNYFRALPKLKVEPAAFAELGGYLVTKAEATGDRSYLEDVREILLSALDADTGSAETHYQLARFFRNTKERLAEDRALDNAFKILKANSRRTQHQDQVLVDTMNRQGEVKYANQEFLEAERKFTDAIALYESGLLADRLLPEAEFGRAYSNLGDLHYYISGDFDAALSSYQNAEATEYSPPDLKYKMGYIHYLNENFDESLLHFYRSAGTYSSNVNLMYATANNLYQRNLFDSAQGYYLHVLNMLETQRKNIEFIRPEERADHRALLENLMKVYNNLGVTLVKLSERSGDEAKVSQALVNFTRSSDFFDRLTRDRETLVRTESKNLAFLNTRTVLYPESDFPPEIYKSLPRDMMDLEF